ncbi:MAG: AAA family ATPase [bacterium]|nr:AAA family ATPase [bacterium]
MQTMYILTGLIGSGKSTWAKNKALEEENIIIVNKDTFRFMIKGGSYTHEREYEPLIKKLAKNSIKIALGSGFNIIIDETNLTRNSRKEYLNLAKAYTEFTLDEIKIVFVYFPEKEQNINNRMKEDKGVSRETWQKVFNNMLETFEEPTEEELPPGGELQTVSN